MNYSYNGDKGRTLKKLIIDNCIMTIVMGNVAYRSSSSQIPRNIAGSMCGRAFCSKEESSSHQRMEYREEFVAAKTLDTAKL